VGGALGATVGAAPSIGGYLTVQDQYQAGLNPASQINYADPNQTALQGINQGVGQNQQLLRQQQGLASTLQNEVQGKGPNPAQAALNQNTGQNISQAAALAAGTRGAGANAGLIAQNAAQQSAATQQQAVGQAATLQAQQQLNAQGQLQAQQQAEQGTIQGEQGIQGNLYGATANANNAQNNTNVAIQGINAQTAQANAAAVNKTTQGIVSGAGGALTKLFAEGGKVEPHLHEMAKIFYPHLYANGGQVDFGVGSPGSPQIPNIIGSAAADAAPSNTANTQQPANPTQSPGTTSATNGYGPGSQAVDYDDPMQGLGGAGGLQDTGGGLISGAAGNGVMTAAYGGKAMKAGGKVPGKPKVNHDDYSNDTVAAKLSPGEVVIDLNTLKDKGKLGQMARFVAANIERKKAGRKA
jgi:hypothetical protein